MEYSETYTHQNMAYFGEIHYNQNSTLTSLKSFHGFVALQFVSLVCLQHLNKNSFKKTTLNTTYLQRCRKVVVRVTSKLYLTPSATVRIFMAITFKIRLTLNSFFSKKWIECKLPFKKNLHISAIPHHHWMIHFGAVLVWLALMCHTPFRLAPGSAAYLDTYF